MQNIYNQDLENVFEVSIEDFNDQNNALNFIPRLALYSLNQEKKTQHYLSGNFGRAIKQSTVVDNAIDIMWSFPDTARVYLKPEKVGTIELGYTIVNDTIGLEARLNLFRNDLSDLVVRILLSLTVLEIMFLQAGIVVFFKQTELSF